MASSTKDKMQLAERLQEFINRSGKSQRQLAEEVGVDETYISKLTTGVTNWTASRKYFAPLARALKLTPEEIAEVNPDMIINVTVDPVVGTEGNPPGRRPRQIRSMSVNGDSHIPELPPEYLVELIYDKNNASGLVLTQDGGRYWLYFDRNIPSGHRVLGSFRGLRIEVRPEVPKPH